MRAAVVTAFGEPPKYGEFPEPHAGPGEVVVDLLATGLHPRVRSSATGKHYSGRGGLPLVPGFDGVGRTPDGSRVYFDRIEAPNGSMAEKIAVPEEKLFTIPEGLADSQIAAIMNPAMSAWVALTLRVGLQPGESVLILGATGCAGQMSVQVAKRLGASRVIGVGRSLPALSGLGDLGADEILRWDGDSPAQSRWIGAVAADVDVVIDYLWGPAATSVLGAIADARVDPARPLRWLHVGDMAGPSAVIGGSALRRLNVVMSGSGQGAVSSADLRLAQSELLRILPESGFRLGTLVAHLADVENTWMRDAPPGSRIVFVP
jgi:NADPH:quinone reductase-like Zn-dependent oxidoreductase